MNLYLPFVAPIEASFESSSEKVSETLIGDHIGKGYGYFCETVVWQNFNVSRREYKLSIRA